MVVRVGLAVVGLFHLANGLAMLLWPSGWAAHVVHLGNPDHLHLHFIADIAMAFLASGMGLLLGARRGTANAMWAIAGATWPALHALLHIKEWVLDGPPPATGDLINEGLGVILVGGAGVALALLRIRQGEA
jgi:hypothetical protein